MLLWNLFLFLVGLYKKVVSCFSDSFDQKTTQQSDSGWNATSDSQFSRKVFEKQLFHFCKCIGKMYCGQKVLHCPPRRQHVLFTHLQISRFLVGERLRLTTETGLFVFHISTQGLSLQTVQVSTQSKYCC